ncbi:sorting nexin-14-like isoform X2 [Cylas formicarius]|uniref:sorting nexin-14-like isoform X2 n=1 Tax=Cylas formicarius TaxID=197179 RepID=UPI002958D36F|nr:sorting nexin-14-like isoform X2 [Cylas formicarius]
MIWGGFAEIIGRIASDNHVRLSCCAIVSLCLISSAFFSPLSGILVFSSYALGYAVSYAIVEYQDVLSWYTEKLITFYNAKFLARKTLRHSCSVCDDLTCKRHRAGKNAMPWKNLRISGDLNTAVQHLYERILDDFVASWYQQFTDNVDFLNELRHCLRYASANVINRLLSTDIADVIATKLAPQAVRHVDDYLYMQQIAKLKHVSFDEVVVEYLGKNLHVATTNRESELAYLRGLSAELLKYVLPESYVNCRNCCVLLREIVSGWVLLPMMDVLADPNAINALVILAANYKSQRGGFASPPGKPVEFLENFVRFDATKRSPFSVSLGKIKNSTDLLYAFMQFLKKHDQVHLLQFCMDVDDFNNKLLTPDLSKKELEALHRQAAHLFKEYLDPDGLNFVGCPTDICVEYSDLIKDIYSVAQLRTSKPLFQAYDFAFNELETVWLPQFFHCNEFYNCICGSKVTATYKKTPAKNRKYLEHTTYGAVSKLSSGIGKIRGVLKTAQTLDGAVEPSETRDDGSVAEDVALGENLIRDLNSWRVTIPSYQTIPATKITYFCVSVQKSGDVADGWIVWRRDQDFYTLKAKLVEFHGETEICESPLPSRKAGSAVESRMLKYERFVAGLLGKRSLRGSDLLYTFLTAEEDFSATIATLAPSAQDIGNIYQSVAQRLRKEKGQNLEAFVATFVGSVTRQNPNKVDVAEDGSELDAGRPDALPRTYVSRAFGDNFGLGRGPSNEPSCSSVNPVAFTECLFYLLRNIFKVPTGALKIYVAVCAVAQPVVDFVVKLLIDRKVRSGLSQANLAVLVGLLEEVIFDGARAPLTAEEAELRKKTAFRDVKFCPGFLDRVSGGEVNRGLAALLEVLQEPHYNKQLAYNLLDIVVVEVFSELAQ